MRTLFRTLTVSGLIALFVGCERPGPVDVQRATADGSHANADSHGGGKPELDPTYVDGKVVYMVGPHLIVNARETQPNLYAHAPELYLLVYPQQDVPTLDSPPITLPSGYEPQCNPCFHPGLPAPFVFHDHVITGAPGMGNDGTAGEMKAPWKLILLVYNPAYVSSPHFTAIKSEDDIDAAETAGNVFLPINPGGENPYEIDTGNVLICPIVGKKP